MAPRPADIPSPPQPAARRRCPSRRRSRPWSRRRQRSNCRPPIPSCRRRRRPSKKPKLTLENVGGPPPPVRPGAEQGGDSQHVDGGRHPPEHASGRPERRPDGRRPGRRIGRLRRGSQSAAVARRPGQRAGAEERPDGRGFPPLPHADSRHHSAQLVRRDAGERQTRAATARWGCCLPSPRAATSTR